jgi:Zn-dependent peptidase ImmA (M78 family)
MLGHELAHILLHGSRGNYNEQQEKEANLFATLITLRYLIVNK